MKRMEVRCCCQPAKLLGWLPVPDQVEMLGSVRFIVRRQGWQLAAPFSDEKPVYLPADVIELPVAKFASAPDWRGHLALKSEETPLERLRLIPGFEEHTDGHDSDRS